MRLRPTALLLSALAVATTVASCADADDAARPTTTTAPTASTTTTVATTSASAPASGTGVVGDEWEVVAPAEVGLDSTVLDEMAAEAAADHSNCLLVVRDGKIAGEWYWSGTGPHTAQEVFSATKSVTSVLVGMAQADGALSIGDSASRWIPEWVGTPAEAVTVRNLLSNDSGRFWSFRSDYGKMLSIDDRTAYGIGLDQGDPPGTIWAYNNAAIQTLEQVLERSTRQPVTEFAAERLFRPLGMADSKLTTDPAGNSLTFMGLQSTCRDMARFGWMVLEQGRWGPEQIVPEAWIQESTGAPSQPLNAAYGYLWWLNRRGPQANAASPVRLEEVPAQADGQLVPGAPEDLVWALGLGSQIVQIHAPTRTVLVRLGPAELVSPYGTDQATRLVTEGLLSG
jgi:CubicO group peptidase (beta-lactamase class C family)